VLKDNDLMLFGQTAQPQKPDKPAQARQEGAALAAAQNPDTGSTLGDLMAQRQGDGRPN
jgi:hypothetical protein